MPLWVVLGPLGGPSWIIQSLRPSRGRIRGSRAIVRRRELIETAWGTYRHEKAAAGYRIMGLAVSGLAGTFLEALFGRHACPPGVPAATPSLIEATLGSITCARCYVAIVWRTGGSRRVVPERMGPQIITETFADSARHSTAPRRARAHGDGHFGASERKRHRIPPALWA